MNELTEKFWPAIKLLILPYCILLFLLFYPINYFVYSPGGLSEVENMIEIDYNSDKVIEGSISTTYIMDLNRPTFFQFIIGYFSPYSTIGELSGSNLDYTNQEIIEISYLDKYTSVDAAIIVAYLQLESEESPGVHISYTESIMVYGKATYLSNYDEIAFGDEFIQVIGDQDEVITTIEGIPLGTTSLDTYTFTFKNEAGMEYLVDLTKNEDTNKFGITLKNYYIVDKENTTPQYTEVSSNIGGPSGGLLQTLSIYNMLSDTDLTHGLKIAGTGTIEYDGSVGYIGGVKQKIATAYLNKVDVFFIPFLDEEYYYDNYIEALRSCDELGIDPTGWLQPVASFQDVLDYLQGLGE
ncbi:MAG: hypothetical protein KJ971_06480 [Firmicutes bacterium]|nr:hypothetical protein [Bacillota bacterium]